MFYFCISIHAWHLTSNQVVLQSRERWAQQSTFGIVFTGHAQFLVVGRSWKHGHWFILLLLSLSLMTAEHCRSSHISACLAFVLQRRDEVAASDIYFVWKEGRVSILLSELSLVVGFQKAYLNSILNQICILFSVLSFSTKKRRSVGFARDIFFKSLVTTYITTKGLASCWTKTGKCSWIITKWDDIKVTRRLFTKNRQIVRYSERNQFLGSNVHIKPQHGCACVLEF